MRKCAEVSEIDQSFMLESEEVLMLGSERFRCVEPLFNRFMSAGARTLQEMVRESIEACPPEYITPSTKLPIDIHLFIHLPASSSSVCLALLFLFISFSDTNQRCGATLC